MVITRLVFFLLAGGTFYMAGMYQQLSLMVLCIAELLLCIVLFCLCRHWKRRVTVTLLPPEYMAEQETAFVCRLRLQNKSRFAVDKLRLKVVSSYRQQKKDERIQGKETLYGYAGSGETSFSFALCAPYCGLIVLRAEKIQIYDPLSLFSSKKRLDASEAVAIFPLKQVLRFSLSNQSESMEHRAEREQLSRQLGEANHEIRQIREYRPGDPFRHIHWNQTARSDTLWVKEYERESDFCPGVFLDLTGLDTASLQQTSAFYELLSACLLGLLTCSAEVLVYWYDEPKKTLTSMQVSDLLGCRKLLLRLYELQLTETQKDKESKKVQYDQAGDGLCLDLALHCYWKGELLYTFSPEKLRVQIEQQVLSL